MGDRVLVLVRVWERQREFRAAVRAPGDDEPRLFTDAARLGEFLHEAAATESTRGASDENDG